jgi:decaprenylphospho-beta-D-ribofuranose 2-oxidase
MTAVPATGVAGADGGRLLTGWGNTAPSRSTTSVPTDAAAVEELLAAADGRGVVARGLGRSYNDAAQNGGGRTIVMTGLHEVLSFDRERGVLRAGAGLSLGEAAELAVPAGWFPPVVPGTRHVTLGGALAADIHGKNHHCDGGFAAGVRGFRLATPAGGVVEVTEAAAPDLFHATAGGMGMTGLVLDVELQLQPIETARIRVERRVGRDLDGVMAALRCGDAHHRYSVAWIDLLARGRRLGRGLVDLGDHAAVDELPAGLRSDPLALCRTRAVSAPPVPVSPLRPGLVAAGNALRFRLGSGRREAVSTIDQFHHPLDRVEHWNRGYGPRGLVQYQFAVPDAAASVIGEVAARVAASRAPAYLAVLKRLGENGGGMLSFPIAGWTLAIDFPAAWPPLGGLLEGFDRLVAEAGGRVYLAKDSRADPAVVESMYPGITRWRQIVARCDPRGVLQSDLCRRLDLRGERR